MLLVAPNLRTAWAQLRSFLGALPDYIAALLRLPRALRRLPQPFTPHDIPGDFLGINVAPGTTSAHNDFVLERLRELGTRRVRINYGYDAAVRERTDPFIVALHSAGFQVLLNVIPPPLEALRLDSMAPLGRWRKFLGQTLERLAPYIAGVEIGSTVNRFGWSGFTYRSYAAAVLIAAELCKQHGLPWYGPNVTDFEPLENVGYLAHLTRRGLRPAAHTNNLFVDRARQPENTDPSVMGDVISRRLPTDLLGKSRIIAALGRLYGMPPRFLCTYTYWTLAFTEFPHRRYATLEQYARYLIRFCALGAAAGYMEGIYWGTLVSYTKGLFDDGTGYKPEPPAVYHLWHMRGKVEDYAERPAFAALRELNARICGTRFMARLPTHDGTWLLHFRNADATNTLVAWTRDGLVDRLDRYVELPDDATFADLYGRPLDEHPPITESPIYVRLDQPRVVVIRGCPLPPVHRYAVPEGRNIGFAPLQTRRWRGVVRFDLQHEVHAAVDEAQYPNEVFEESPAESAAWHRAPLPGNPQTSLLWLRYPAASHGNGPDGASVWTKLCEWISRNLWACLPVAFLEPRRPDSPWSFIAVDDAPGHIRLRDALRLQATGNDLPDGLTGEALLKSFALFATAMHDGGVSNGALPDAVVVTPPARTDAPPVLQLVDAAGCRFGSRLSAQARTKDLAAMDLPLEQLRQLAGLYARPHLVRRSQLLRE